MDQNGRMAAHYDRLHTRIRNQIRYALIIRFYLFQSRDRRIAAPACKRFRLLPCLSDDLHPARYGHRGRRIDRTEQNKGARIHREDRPEVSVPFRFDEKQRFHL